MMTCLLITVRFLDERFHGLLDRDGPAEWPPSPFRLFQALIAGVARRCELVIGEDTPSNVNYTDLGRAIDWLQHLPAPIVVAPRSRQGIAITRFVPNNDGDETFDRQRRLTAKLTIPTLMLIEPDQRPEVHYVWDISKLNEPPIDRIRDAARSITSLGWGIDMAFADSRLATQTDIESLPGVRWYPTLAVRPDDVTLRVPKVDKESNTCSLCDLRHCHDTLMNRIKHGRPLGVVDKPKVFDEVSYSERLFSRFAAVFSLLDADGDRVSYSHRNLIHIAGMVRHLAIERLRNNLPHGVSEDWIASFVAGHQSMEDKEAKRPHSQLSYIPLPSIGNYHTDPSVRRVMIVGPPGKSAWLEHVSRCLDGQFLEPLPGTTLPSGAHLKRIPPTSKDGVWRLYSNPAKTWTSITPVILPGHDDHRPAKRQKLIQKALAQSGIEASCEFEPSSYSRFPKVPSAHKYDRNKRPQGFIRPDHLMHQTAVHLTIRFQEPVPGPIVIGAGRHCGFGLMAHLPDSN